jgi:predicted nucleic acid-binding protein
MPNYYFDTSALAKRYHMETGTSRVDQLVDGAHSHCLISRIGLVELHSVLVKHVRLGNLSSVDLNAALLRLQSDLATSLLKVIPVEDEQFESSEALLQRHGPTRSLYALDAIHLAVAQALRAIDASLILVCSDQRLLAVAAEELFPTLNPEQP